MPAEPIIEVILSQYAPAATFALLVLALERIHSTNKHLKLIEKRIDNLEQDVRELTRKIGELTEGLAYMRGRLDERRGDKK